MRFRSHITNRVLHLRYFIIELFTLFAKKRIKCSAEPRILSLFLNLFNKSNNICAFILDPLFSDYGYGLIDPADIPRGPFLTSQPDNIIVSEANLILCY